MASGAPPFSNKQNPAEWKHLSCVTDGRYSFSNVFCDGNLTEKTLMIRLLIECLFPRSFKRLTDITQLMLKYYANIHRKWAPDGRTGCLLMHLHAAQILTGRGSWTITFTGEEGVSNCPWNLVELLEGRRRLCPLHPLFQFLLLGVWLFFLTITGEILICETGAHGLTLYHVSWSPWWKLKHSCCPFH